MSNTIAVRTEDGTLKSNTPSGDDPNEVVTVEIVT